jgi:LacI family transcriptional regulator
MGAERVTIQDVAKRAGVSLGTVSRVLNGQKSVGPEIRARVEQAIIDLGYRPNAVAQSMRRGNSRAVGIMLREFTLPVLAGFIKAVQQVLRGAGYSLILAGSDDQREREIELLDALSSRRIDGLILTTSSEADEDLLQRRAALQVPVVLLDRTVPATFDALLIGHRAAVRRAVEYLLKLGHRRIALLTGAESVRPAAERVLGYRDAFERAGIELDLDLIRARNFGAEFGYRETLILLGRRPPPTALIAGGIAMLPGVLRAVRERGLRIPDDVSIIGSCDSDLAELGTPPVSVLRWDYARLGRVAAELLLERIEGDRNGPPRQIEVDAELVIRGSCGPPPARRRNEQGQMKRTLRSEVSR